MDYAKQHDLNPQALYYWSTTLRRKGILEEQATQIFAEVKVGRLPASSAAPTETRVRLANGLELELVRLNEQTLRWLAAL